MVTRSANVAARTLSLSLRTVTGKDLEFTLPVDASVLQVKEAVLARDGTTIATQRVTFLIRTGSQRTPAAWGAWGAHAGDSTRVLTPPPPQIICDGKELEDASTLEAAGVSNSSKLFVSRTKDPAHVLRRVEARASPWTVLRTKGVQIMVKTLKDRLFLVTASPATTVLDVKHRVAEEDPTWEVARQRIIFKGQELPDEKPIAQCGLDDGAPTCHVVMRLPAPGAARKRRDDASSCSSAKTPASPTRSTALGIVKLEDNDISDDALTCNLDDLMAGADSLPMEFDTAWSEFQEESTSHDASSWDTNLDLPSMASPTAALSPLPKASRGEASGAVIMEAIAIPSAAPFSDMGGQVAMATVKAEPGDMDLPVPSTQGRAYDLNKVDDKLRKRLLKNRLSAERSRQRKQGSALGLSLD
ncbi:hypothetical protein T484DRAFT_1847312 [Baffinella frigidus]|nr:hypothetical protein T484DRAFT_1847312 [Cryptophyta sp. CCMP2293]